MDITNARVVDDDLIDIKLSGYGDNYESDGDDKSDVEKVIEQRDQSIPPRKCLGKSTSLRPTLSSPEIDDELGTALQRIFCEDSGPSLYSRSLSLPIPLKSALKGSREKQGLCPKKLTVTWAPDVYDPIPTSVLHTVKNKKQKQQQQKSKKNNDKKKNGKKGQKGLSRGSGGKDNKQLRRGSGSSDPYCGSSFLKKSPTRMHYSVEVTH